MLKTRLCEVLGIEVPIILAPMGSATSAEFAAAVSNQGGLGGIGSLFRTTAAIKRDIDAVRELTNRHYAVNHIPPTLDAEAFALHAGGAAGRDLLRARRPGRPGQAGPRCRLEGDAAGHDGRASRSRRRSAAST